MAIRPVLTVLVSLAAAWFLHFFWRMYKHRRWYKGLPQPPHSFFWGHLKVMGEAAAKLPPNCHPQAYLTYVARKYDLKGVFYLDLWPVAEGQVVLTEPDVMNQVTVTRALPIHKMADDYMAPMVGRNVIATANGAIWKKTHNAMAPAFSWSHIRSLTGVVTEEIMHFRDALDAYAQTQEVFSLEETAAKLIFDVIARVVFNFPLYAQTKGSTYLEDLRELIHLANAQFSWNPLTKLVAFFKRRIIVARLDPSIVNKIKERLSLLRRDNIVPSRKDPFSILDLMLREHLQGDPDMKGKSTEDLSPEYLQLLVTNIKGLLLGGHGTTTDTLCVGTLQPILPVIQIYIYMLLSNHPDVVQKLREEHSRVFHEDFTETLNILRDSPHTLSELEYTDAVIKETLRLFPIGFGVREAEHGATVAYDGKKYPIDNGLAVVVTAHTLHYDPSFYPNPTEFQPERFMDPENSIPRACFRTFGRGARACLGQNLAQDELKVILLMTVRYYDFECAGLKPNEKPKTNYTDLDTIYGDIIFQELGLEARPRGGMMMRVRKRA